MWILFYISIDLFLVDRVAGRGFRSYRGNGGSGTSSLGGMIAGFVFLGLMFLIVIAVLIYRCYSMKQQGRTFFQSNTNRTQPTMPSSVVASGNTTSPPKDAPPPYRNDYVPEYSTFPPPPAYTWSQQSQDPVYPPPPPASNY
ncbi:cysteine and tyrosine-rich protein 1-like [Mercenaria mercenaria]|uniref:cysteine and tyrosine-rich protein 1-like n=1 Tax=Mercenaria mercenaria TaxID=6596 RepID=UPI00234EF5F8|nr:cysteine and tyrosine-rich protein 1-like [Mercenaria mercenaria]